MIQLNGRTVLLVLGLCLTSLTAHACEPSARVFFIEPRNGAVLFSPFRVIFGSELVQVKPAGEVDPNSGHNTLFINAGGALPKGELIPTDDHHIHCSNAQTRTELDLPPGEYQLTLQFADGAERSHGPQMSASIHITVN